MISTDLLSILMRGTQGLPVGGSPEAAAGPPADEESFDQFFGEACRKDDGADPSAIPSAMVAPQPASEPARVPPRLGAAPPDAAAPDAAAPEAVPDAAVTEDEAVTEVVPGVRMPAEAAIPAPAADGAIGTGAAPLRAASSAPAVGSVTASGAAMAVPDPGAGIVSLEENAGRQGSAAVEEGAPPDRQGSGTSDRPGLPPERPARDAPVLQARQLETARAAEPPVVEPASVPASVLAASGWDRPTAADRPPSAALPMVAGIDTAPSPSPGLSLIPAEVEPGWRLGIEPAAAMAREIPAAPAPAAPPAAVANQVVTAIRSGEGERIEIRLDPPELGRVQIEMRIIDGALHAVVVAERPEIGDILRRHAEMLQRDLEAAGYASVSLEFATGHERKEAEQHHGAPSAGPGLSPTTATPTPLLRAAALDRLDIRL